MIATLKTFATLSVYGASIVPRARREIRRWAAAAAAIPDPTLRSYATHAIRIDASNAEAVAALAATAPRRQRRTTVKLLVAYQVLVDYVDTVGERVCADELLRGLEIGMALAAAIGTSAPPPQLDSFGDDGGYLVDLVATCRGRLWQLPSAAVVAPEAKAAAIRCGQALAHTHAAALLGTTNGLREWTNTQPRTAGYAWWEIAAGGNSSITILALLAAAADPATTRSNAAALAAAYWPHLSVMSTMLDSLVDFEGDATTGDFSFVSHYPSRAAIRDGLITATARSLAATAPLRHSQVHTMIVWGIAGYYAASAAQGSCASGIAPSLLAALGPSAAPITFALRARHRIVKRERPLSPSVLRCPANTSTGRDSLPDGMAEQVPAVGDILTTIERRDWQRLERLLHPEIHWTTAAEEHMHGPAEVIARLSGDPPPAAPAYHEMRGGLLVRWIDSPG